MKVEIWSDYVCPFCYIGKRKFESALASFEHKDSVVTELRSFELDPSTDSSLGMTTHEMLSRKYGMSLEQAKSTGDGVVQQAAAVGLTFRLDGALSLNTFNAHRLAHYAEEQGKGAAMSERLLKAYFTDNLNIDDPEQLAELADEVGLDKDAALAVLQSDSYADSVRAQEQEGSRLGIRGVPFFVIDRKYAVSGAQPPEVFLETLKKAWAERS
ncbi:DsbA family oxidoreductase [Paenibacillus sp. PAMC21692]|uniref:DsbA family oxidoreductase n=1 Tax=Paenibacillus sp. PAMC21692 TaxID=2762320 RepID=UPI00164E9003|nr:DsbA family oxidoreductase [Paenibacillus sp. PAMC21692]QNK55191.1 DsbA family oxidoreductase [Paenibacillus sp. PAMC21692]